MTVPQTRALFDLTGRAAVVTGGNAGIGYAIAAGLAGAGAAVAVAGRRADRNREAVEALEAAGCRAVGIEADVTDPDDCRMLVDRAAEAFGRLDILVANAGTNVRKQPEDYTLEEFRGIIDVNLTSTFLCAQAAYPHFKKAGGGKIITIGSVMSVSGAAFAAPYAASKGGVVQLTRCLASAWGKDGVQANAILPGWIDTELTQKAREDVAGLDEKVVARTPAGRWGRPGDLVGAAVFLASSASDFVTTAAIPVDGGYIAQG